MKKNKYSIFQAAGRLGISRTTLNKEIEDGNITAHKRRGRIIFFEEDLRAYEQRNAINNQEALGRIDTCNNIRWQEPVDQTVQAVQN